MPPKKVGRPRSSSRGRAATKASPAKSAKKETPAPAAARKSKGHELRGTHTHDMAFDEGDDIMARWPGTSLYFKVRHKIVLNSGLNQRANLKLHHRSHRK